MTIDCPRTFPKTIHDTVLSTTAGEQALARVLMAYAYRNKILGYCQSLNFIAGLFLCVFDEDTAFWLLTVRPSIHPSVRACVRVCMRAASVRPCVRACARARVHFPRNKQRSGV